MISRFKNASKYLLGARLSKLLSGIVRGVFGRIDIARNLSGRYDIIFYCEQPSHWQNIQEAAMAVCEEGRLKVGVILSYKLNDYSQAEYPSDIKVLFGRSTNLLQYVKTRVLCTPFTGMGAVSKPKGAIVVHALVSLTSLDGVYPHDMFDDYDYIFCGGGHHLEDFRRWRLSNHRLKGRVLIPSGYPKLDLVSRRAARAARTEESAQVLTVVYAPTHIYQINESLASLRLYGEKIIDGLLSMGVSVIFRPHPVSFHDSDADLIKYISRKHMDNPMFYMDNSKDYFDSYSRSHLIVTDLSGTGFTFSLSFLKPAIFFVSDEKAECGLIGIQFEDREKIGGVVSSVSDMINLIRENGDKDFSSDIRKYRDELLFNFGFSAKYMAESLIKIAKAEIDADWIIL